MPPAGFVHTGMTVGGNEGGDAGWATAVAPRGVGLYFGLLHEGRLGDNAARFGSRTEDIISGMKPVLVIRISKLHQLCGSTLAMAEYSSTIRTTPVRRGTI